MTELYIDRQIAALRKLHQNTLQLDRGMTAIRDYLMLQANTLFAAHAEGNDAVVFHLSCWCQPLIGKRSVEIMSAPLSIDLINASVAREHGYQDWTEVEALGDSVFDDDFEQAVDLVLSGQETGLAEKLNQSPQLINQVSQYGHQATLLHYVAANGVESHRQIVPSNAADIIRLLIKAGAEVNAEANIYGGGSRVLGLLETSAHPRNAGIGDSLRKILLDAGAH